MRLSGKKNGVAVHLTIYNTRIRLRASVCLRVMILVRVRIRGGG
jgi:hypothetical protein